MPQFLSALLSCALVLAAALPLTVTAGCASAGNRSASPVTSPATNSAANPTPAQDKLRQELKAVLDAHPELVLEVLDQNKVAVFEIVEKGIRLKQEQAQAEQMKESLKAPLSPVVDPARPMLGAADAAVTIVEYSDFLCPYCAKAAQTMRELLGRHPGQIRILFKHLPLHDGAEDIARHFEAAGMQGADKAWKFHDLAFARMRELGDKPEATLAALVKEVGLDPARLAQDLKSKLVSERLAADEAEARRFNLSGTPMFLVNGALIQGAQPVAAFEEVLKALGVEAKP